MMFMFIAAVLTLGGICVFSWEYDDETAKQYNHIAATSYYNGIRV